MTELDAHRDFSTLLESCRLKWSLEAEQHRAAIQEVKAKIEQMEREVEGLENIAKRDPSSRPRYGAAVGEANREQQRLEQAIKPQVEVLAFLEVLIQAAADGYLAVTEAEREDPGAWTHGPPELVEMAKLAGRLRIID